MDDKKLFKEFELDNITLINKNSQSPFQAKLSQETDFNILKATNGHRIYGINSDSEVNLRIIPANMKKVFIMTILLLFLGLFLIGFGILSHIYDPATSHIYSCLLLGSMLLTPGFFYSYQFYLIRIAKNRYERDRIINSFPKI